LPWRRLDEGPLRCFRERGLGADFLERDLGTQ
jgi:hypothetical protein